MLDNLTKLKVSSIVDRPAVFCLILFGMIATLTGLKAPTLIIAIFCIPAFGFFFVAMYFYIKFAKENPNFLRGEAFHIQKDRLEVYGNADMHTRKLLDNDEEVISSPLTLDNPDVKKIGK